VIATFEQWLETVRRSGLLTDAQIDEVTRLGRGRQWQEWEELFELLARKGLVSIYASRKILQGKVDELFFGPFVLLDKLGEGGMGKVYRVRRRHDGAIFALKVVRAHLLVHPLIRRRYEREVAAATRLHHPNIVRVCEAGQHEGRYYLVMEFVDGIDLSRLGKEYRPLAIPEACEYVRQAALGLQHAHEQGLVHRDIKPSNIMVAGERHLPQAMAPAIAKILDMGLVRAVGAGEEEVDALALTREGTVVGTPDYMAPEQAKNSRRVDPRADLYSLGCTLYFLLTGRPPFAEGTAIEKILKHQLDPVPPIRNFRPDVPADVEKLLLRLLAKQPDDRPASALIVAQELEQFCRYPFALHPAAVSVRQAGDSGVLLSNPPSNPSTPAGTPTVVPQPTDPQAIVATPPLTASATPLVAGASSVAEASSLGDAEKRSVPPRSRNRLAAKTSPPATGRQRTRVSEVACDQPVAARRPSRRQQVRSIPNPVVVVVATICLLLTLLLVAALWWLQR
jgi:serine/threonine-protein kinase